MKYLTQYLPLQWCDVKGHNLLHKLYEDPKRWSFQFQSYVQLTRSGLNSTCTIILLYTIEKSRLNLLSQVAAAEEADRLFSEDYREEHTE